MDKLIFLTNDLLNPKLQREMKLPLKFISFAISEGKMYRGIRNISTITTSLDSNKLWGNIVVYGAIFLCNDFEHYSRIIDGYNVCSKSALGRNHMYDLNHRFESEVTMIHFNSIEELVDLRYIEQKKVLVEKYLCNTSNPKIKKRINSINPSYRVIDGVQPKDFKELFWEVSNGRY